MLLATWVNFVNTIKKIQENEYEGRKANKNEEKKKKTN